MSDRMDIDIMAELHQKAIEAAEKALFEDNFDKHGWTKEAFYNYFVDETQAVADYTALVKPLIDAGHLLLN